MLRQWNLNKRDYRIARAVNFLVSRIRNIDHAVARGAKDRAQRFDYAEDLERTTGNSDFLPNHTIGGRAAKKVFQHVGTDDADFTARGAFGFGPDAARVNGAAVDVKHRRWRHAADIYILEFLVGVFDRLAHIRCHTDAPTGRAQARNGVRIFMRNVFALVEFYELFARADDLWPFRDGEDSGTLRRKRSGDFVVQTLNDRDHRDHRRDPDDYAHEREGSAQLVCAQTAKRNQERLP